MDKVAQFEWHLPAPATGSRASNPCKSSSPLDFPKLNKILLGKRMQAESGASYRKERIGVNSTRYAKRGSSASQCPVPGRVFLEENEEINRDIALIENPVSHSKQRAARQINRNISAAPRSPFFLFAFLFSNPNRSNKLLEFVVSHEKQSTLQKLIATSTGDLCMRPRSFPTPNTLPYR